MTLTAELTTTTADDFGLLRMVESVERFERRREGKTEQWIHIMPAGPVVVARDGRTFQVSDLLKLSAQSELPLLVDWEHNSEFGQTRAAGWVEELSVETGKGEFPRAGIWGRTDWTEQGKRDVQSRAYRYLSPTLLIDKETRNATQILAVALTNRPALSMQALDTFRERMSALVPHQERSVMTPAARKTLCSLLHLSESASDAAILAAAAASQAPARMSFAPTTGKQRKSAFGYSEEKLAKARAYLDAQRSGN